MGTVLYTSEDTRIIAGFKRDPATYSEAKCVCLSIDDFDTGSSRLINPRYSVRNRLKTRC